MLEIAQLLEEAGESGRAMSVRWAVEDDQVDDFIASKGLWGGAGTIEDDSLLYDARRPLLDALLDEVDKAMVSRGRPGRPSGELWSKAFVRWFSSKFRR